MAKRMVNYIHISLLPTLPLCQLRLIGAEVCLAEGKEMGREGSEGEVGTPSL